MSDGEQDGKQTQRLGAYAIVREDDSILLTRISAKGYPAGSWTLPGGAVEHGESPTDAVKRELFEETGLQAHSVTLAGVHDIHTVDIGRGDRFEDYHGVHLLYFVSVDSSESVHVTEAGGTTDKVAWMAIDDITTAHMPVLEMVTHALTLSP